MTREEFTIEEMKVWVAVAAGYASASNSGSRQTMCDWANKAVDSFRDKFKGD